MKDKSILVVNKVNECWECDLCEPIGEHNTCVALGKIVTDTVGIHRQCPLKDTTELLEAVKIIARYTGHYSSHINNQYDKLYKALGGNDNE